MTDDEIQAVGKLADVCRSKGIRILDIPNNIRLEFDGPADAAPQRASKPDVATVDLCKCMHPEFAHMNGLCVHGCSPEKCAEGHEAPAPQSS